MAVTPPSGCQHLWVYFYFPVKPPTTGTGKHMQAGSPVSSEIKRMSGKHLIAISRVDSEYMLKFAFLPIKVQSLGKTLSRKNAGYCEIFHSALCTPHTNAADQLTKYPTITLSSKICSTKSMKLPCGFYNHHLDIWYRRSEVNIISCRHHSKKVVLCYSVHIAVCTLALEMLHVKYLLSIFTPDCLGHTDGCRNYRSCTSLFY